MVAFRGFGEGIINHRSHARAAGIALAILLATTSCSPSSNDAGDGATSSSPSGNADASIGTGPGDGDGDGDGQNGGVTPGPTGFRATEGPVPAEHARAMVDGTFLFFDRVVGSCTINGSVIVFAHRSRGDGPDLVTGSSSNGWIRVRLSSTTAVGYRMRLDMSDPALELDVEEGAFSITGPATFHTDVDDLDDPGSDAGEMTVTAAC